MKSRLLALLGSLLLYLTTSADIIPSERRTDWSHAGVVGGIPTVTKIYTNLSPGVTLAKLNSCLASCPSNEVVYLSPGEYTFAGPIDFGQNEGVVLRGAGAGRTIITFNAHGGSANITIGEQTVNRVAPPSAQVKNWIGGYSQGSTSITLDSVSGLPSPGHILVLDQLDDNVLVDADIQEGCDYCGRQSGERTMAQYVRIMNVVGNNVTISPGLHMPNWRSGQSPQAWYWNEKDTIMCGVEDITINNNVNSGLFAIQITQAQNCWVKDVHIYKSAQAAIETSLCKNIEVRRVTMAQAQSSTSQSYGVVWYMCSDGLMIDCIAHDITGAMNFGPQAAGCVVAYNYFTNLVYTPNTWNIAALASHDAHVCMNLLEGNYANTAYFDSIHGSCSHNTVFRNRLTGWQPNRSGNTVALAFEQFCRSNNVIGNVLGKSGYHTYYSVTNQSQCGTYSDKSIFILGTGNANCGSGALPLTWDPIVAASTLIHGNYDYFRFSQSWDGVISDRLIPASLFSVSKPAFFGNLPYPPFDPANPASASPTNIPAGYRFIFGVEPPADGRPAAPSSLRIVPGSGYAAASH